MAPIDPFIFICFAACIGLALSLWQRRETPGAATLAALAAAIWGGIWVQVLQGDSLAGFGTAFALFQFVPVLFFIAVCNSLTAPPAFATILRGPFLATGSVFAVLAATSPWHNYFIGLDASAVDGHNIVYRQGSYVAVVFAAIVAALGIFVGLVHGNRGPNRVVRGCVYIAFPLALLMLGISGPMLGVNISGLNPAIPSTALALALGAWMLVRFDTTADGGVRNLLFSRLPDPVLALDASGQILDCNEAFAELVDYPLDELPGSMLATVVSEENFAALTASDGQEFELRWQAAENVVEHYNVFSTQIEEKADARLLHLTESVSHRHAQQALETADMQLERANASVDRLTFNDELTGLANQRRFLDELEKEISRHQRSGLRFGVIAIEADHFNLLAEQHGTAFRDRSLALIARAIEVEVRDTDLCARFDGEEFAVLAVQMKVPGLVNLAERIRKRVLKVRPHAPGGERVRMSVSCGVGVFDPKQDDLRGLLARANRYLTQAKRSGRNQVVSDD